MRNSFLLVSCHNKRCMHGQMCIMINKIPVCACPGCSRDLENTPVCGEANQKQYPNECTLRRDECLIGKKIGMKDGLCQGESKVFSILYATVWVYQIHLLFL